MAGAALSDDVALLARVTGAIFRHLAKDAPGRWVAGIGGPAAGAGLSAEQARAFVRGDLVLPPHQCLVLMDGVLEKERLFSLALAEYRTAGAPPPVTGETVRAEVEQLGKDFPAWRIGMPQNWETLGTDETRVLVWSAQADDRELRKQYGHTGGWPDVHAATARELRGQLERVEAAFESDRRQQEQFDGAGVIR